jgi:SM-20-related protein
VSAATNRFSIFNSLGVFVLEDFLDSPLRLRLQSEMRAAVLEQGRVIRDANDDDGTLDENARKVWCAQLAKPTRALVKSRLLDLKPSLEEHFQISLTGCEAPGFLVYREGGFYTPHKDASPGSPEFILKRRVSVVVFLNGSSKEPAENCYGGGSLTFYGLLDGPKWEKYGMSLEPQPGLLVAFRSHIIHEVNPVAFGHRFTIAAWYFADDPVTSPISAGKGDGS